MAVSPLKPDTLETPLRNSKSFESILLSTQFALLVVWPIVQALGLPSLGSSGFAHRFRYTRLFCQLS